MPSHQPNNESPDQLGQLAFKAVGVKKHYPGVKALDGVDLEGYAGRCWPSAAPTAPASRRSPSCWPGSTPRPTARSPSTGYPHPVRNAAEAEQAGVLMMHQEPLIIDDFTVGENVWLYKLREGKDIRPWAQKVDTNSAETREVLQGVGLGHLSHPAAGPRPRTGAAPDAVAEPGRGDHAQDHDPGRDHRLDQRGALQRHPRPGRPGEGGRARRSSSSRTGSTRSSRCATGSRCCATASWSRSSNAADSEPGRDHHADDRPGPEGAGPAGPGRRSSRDQCR